MLAGKTESINPDTGLAILSPRAEDDQTSVAGVMLNVRTVSL
jgi:hypothetical protein